MAAIMKMFDFRAQEGNFKNQASDFPKAREAEKVKEQDSPFKKALQSVSESVSKDKPGDKETQSPENREKNIRKAEKQIQKLQKKIQNLSEKNSEDPKYAESLLQEIQNLLKIIREVIPEKGESTKSMQLSVHQKKSFQNLMQDLSSIIENIKKQINAELSKDQIKKFPEMIEKIQNQLQKMKILKTPQPMEKGGTGIGQSLFHPEIRENKGEDSKEKRIFDVKIHPNAKKTEKNSGGLSIQQTGNNLTQSKAEERMKQPEQNSLQSEFSSAKKSVDTSRQNSKKAGRETDNSKTLKTGTENQKNEWMNIQQTERKDTTSIGKTHSTENLSRAQLGKQILNQLGEKVQGFIGKNSSHITVELKPEALGKVKIILDMKNDVMKGRVIVENGQVKQAVEDNLQQIKSILQESGVKLSSLEVATQGGKSNREQQQEYRLQETVAKNRKVNSILSDIKTYNEIQENRVEWGEGFSISV
jgi:flagellar hook-length control protein FliK